MRREPMEKLELTEREKACQIWHGWVKTNAKRFAMFVDLVGVHDDGEERLVMGNCRDCGTTLCISEPSIKREVIRFARGA